MSDMNSSRSDAPGWEVTPDQLKQLGMFYHCRAGCLYQDGSTSKAPTLLFAGADYEPGDGPTRLHDDAKYVDEPAIIYVRLDSYLAALKPAPTDEPEPNTGANRLTPDWQPIETAPKGEHILLGYEQQGDEMPTGLLVGVGVVSSQGKIWPMNSGDNEKALPSSWMPLPPAPGEDTQPETTPRVEATGITEKDEG